MKLRLFSSCGAALALAACQTAGTSETQLRAAMSGAQEVPTSGDPDGSGSFVATVKRRTSELCYDLEVAAIDPATAAHIHRGRAGEVGPPVVTLEPPTHGESSACVNAGSEIAAELAADPTRFYVNVHNAAFAAGAVRGQLGR